MSTYEWDFGSVAEGLQFKVVYDSVAGTFTTTVLFGSMNVNALYWSDGNTVDSALTGLTGFTGAKSESSLNMNGSGEVWDGGLKISDAGLGKVPPSSYITADPNDLYGSSFSIAAPSDFDPTKFGTLGVRATSTTSAGGSIKWTDDTPDTPPTNHPPVAVDDDPACGTEHTPVTGNVLANDSDPDGDALAVTAVNGVALSTLIPDGDGWYTIVLAHGTLMIQTDGDFQYQYTGADIPVGGHADPVDTFSYDISDGKGGTDSADVDLCIYADAGSPGYWKGHDGSGPQANDWDIPQDTSFETYFTVNGPYAGGQWDVSSPVNGSGALVNDFTFHDALSLPNGDGGQNLLAKEAVNAVLNLLDEDTNPGFMAAYIYQREHHASADPDAANNLTGLTADQIKADLIAQVQDAYSGAPDAYSIAELTDLLIHTHE